MTRGAFLLLFREIMIDGNNDPLYISRLVEFMRYVELFDPSTSKAIERLPEVIARGKTKAHMIRMFAYFKVMERYVNENKSLIYFLHQFRTKCVPDTINLRYYISALKTSAKENLDKVNEGLNSLMKQFLGVHEKTATTLSSLASLPFVMGFTDTIGTTGERDLSYRLIPLTHGFVRISKLEIHFVKGGFKFRHANVGMKCFKDQMYLEIDDECENDIEYKIDKVRRMSRAIYDIQGECKNNCHPIFSDVIKLDEYLPWFLKQQRTVDDEKDHITCHQAAMRLFLDERTRYLFDGKLFQTYCRYLKIELWRHLIMDIGILKEDDHVKKDKSLPPKQKDNERLHRRYFHILPKFFKRGDQITRIKDHGWGEFGENEDDIRRALDILSADDAPEGSEEGRNLLQSYLDIRRNDQEKKKWRKVREMEWGVVATTSCALNFFESFKISTEMESHSITKTYYFP